MQVCCYPSDNTSTNNQDLCHAALIFASDTLKAGGHFICKFYQGAEDKALQKKLQKMFEKVHREKPESSRSVSYMPLSHPLPLPSMLLLFLPTRLGEIYSDWLLYLCCNMTVLRLTKTLLTAANRTLRRHTLSR